MPARFATIDEYLDGVNPDQRAALEALRRTILEAVPDAVECIAWQMPSFRRGKLLVGFAAWANHCALYPMSGHIVAQFQSDLAGFACTAGTIRFTPEKPLPPELVKEIVLARLAENEDRAAQPKRSAAQAK
jgi:uncharacterized protein YdhG (YjbR/CyaY superfamily)